MCAGGEDVNGEVPWEICVFTSCAYYGAAPPETIRRVTAVTSRCARGDCVTSIAHTTGLYDDTTSSGLEERLEG